MTKINWTKSLSVNNSELDDQHQKLFRFYNDLHESLLNDSIEETIKTKLSTLDNLAEYVSYHFKSEERYMKNMGYTGLSKHCACHQEFTTKVNALQEDVKQKRLILSTSLIKFLRNWIVEHIAHEDQKYATAFKHRQ